MISNAAMYILFAMLIIISLENPFDIEGKLDFDWSYNFTGLMMAVGFLLKDIEDMYLFACSVTVHVSFKSLNRKSLNRSASESSHKNFQEKTDEFLKKCKGFFGNPFLTFKFSGHFLFLLGALLQGLGYQFDPIDQNLHNNTSANMEKTQMIDDDLSH